MYLSQRFNMYQPAQFAGYGTSGAGNLLLGTTQKWSIDRTWPIEEIIIHVCFQVTTALTFFAATALSPDNYDGILQLLQHVNLSVNDGKQPRSVVDASGVGLLEYAQNVGLNLPQATLTLIAASGQYEINTGGTLTVGQQTLPVGCYVLTYRIPMCHPWIGEPLRSRFYLPVHLYPQDPVITLQFAPASVMYSSGVIGAINAEIQLVRRVPTAASEAALQATAGTNPNGYIDSDLIETPFGVPLGVGSEQRFPLPIPGQYTEILMRQYRGGTYVTREPIDATGDGATVTAGTGGFGNEQRWRLESGLVVIREWKWRHLRELNDLTRPQWPTALPVIVLSSGTVSSAVLSTGNIGAVSNAAVNGSGWTNFRNPISNHLDFLSDGLTGDPGVELGSLLDCNTPANNGLKMEIIGTPASVTTCGSMLYVMGRRYFGDLSKWQKFA